jgi:hypothetical protein
MIVECKAPTTAVAPGTLTQASVYNATLQAQYLSVTNGLLHYCAHIDWEHRKTTLLPEFPSFKD